MPTNKYSEEQRSEVIAFHIQGLNHREIRERTGIPVATITTWIEKAGLNSIPIDEPVHKDIMDLIQKNLQDNFEILGEIKELCKNQSWLQKQSAAEITMLWNTITEKSYTIIGTLYRPEEEDQTIIHTDDITEWKQLSEHPEEE